MAALALLGWQAVVAGQTVWLAATAARSAARAQALGADATTAARSALPVRLRRGLRVHAEDGGVAVVLVVPAVVGGVRLGTVGSRARFPAQGAR